MQTELLDREDSVPISTGEDDLRQFLSEIRQFPLLSPQAERELARRCAEGDEDAIRQMVNSNLRLVVSIAREYAGRGVPLLDLIQEGSIGLLVAARKFDHTLDFRFSTYATKWIRQGVTRCLLNHSGTIRVPVYTGEQMRRVLAVQAALAQELEREPEIGEIADRCGYPADRVRKLLMLRPEVRSLDVPAGSEQDPVGKLIEDLEAPEPQAELVRAELKQTLERLLSELSERQQRILRLRFGMEDGKCHALEEIGTLLGVSKERARQIEHQAIEKLRRMGADVGLEDFLE